MTISRAAFLFSDFRPLARGAGSDYISGMSEPASSLQASIVRGLSCRCPRCGKGRLFDGFLTLKPRCDGCGLDYAFVDSGDGPAVFVVFIAGFVVVFAALAVEVVYAPPLWLH